LDPAHDAPPERDARPMIEANNHGALRFLQAFAPVLRPNARLVVIASGFGLLKNLPEHLRARFDTHANTPDAIDRTMDDYVAAAEAQRLDAEGWPAWINIPSKIGQVAVTRSFARRHAADPARQPGVLINAACPGLTLTDATVGLMDNVFKGRPAQTPEEAAAHLLWLVTLPAGTETPHGELVQQRRILRYGD
jgi:carbonyl reductase 1